MLNLNQRKYCSISFLKSRSRGFTLIEVLIAIAIIGVVSAIAYPSYTEYVKKARRVDATEALMALAIAEEKHYIQYKTYINNVTTLSGDDDNTTHDYYTLAITPISPYNFDTSFVITATAKTGTTQADDLECYKFTINSKNERNSKDSNDADTTDCW